jgi:hypothetical protein
LAFDQPPAYQAQSMPPFPFPLSRSPIVGFVCGGRIAPKAPDGLNAGCIVLTP